MPYLTSSTYEIDRMRADLSSNVEQLGFFLADFDVESDSFDLRDWQPVVPEGLATQSALHIALTEESQRKVIDRAWKAGTGLVEVHSHVSQATPAFSFSDLIGFQDWVPHVRWRLGGLPYAAMVWNRTTFDGFAWTGSDRDPVQIDCLELVDSENKFEATGRTLIEMRGGRHVEI